MNDPVINRTEAIKRFKTLLDPERPEHYLSLSGEAKMGKSHLLTKVFPRIARDLGADCVVIDLRNKALTLVDHLRHITNILGRDHFGQFSVAYEVWRNRPTIEEADLQTILANSVTRVRDEKQAESLIVPLTRSLVDDLDGIGGRTIVLVFDAVEQADATTQAWLMDDLLLRLSRVASVSIVVAGRTVPEPSAAYTAIRHNLELGPVEEVDEYIRYCRAIGADLADQSIRDLARAFDYVPGIFAETVSGFVPGGVGHDDQTRLAQLSKRLQEADDQTEKAAIVAEMAIERLAPDTANIARRCVILRWFDVAMVQAIVDHDVTDASPELAQTITEKLATLPFVETLDWGLAYHDQTRAGLLKLAISTDPEFLCKSAALAAPAYANRDSELASAEALYCWVVAGKEEEAHSLLDALLAAAGRHHNWQSFGTLFANIAEAEELPFVNSLPVSANQFLERGIARYDQGDLDNAIADYDQAIILNPDDAIAFLNRGIARRVQGNFDAAASDFIQAIAPASAIAVNTPHSTVSSKRNRAQSSRGKTDPNLLRRLQAGDNLAWEQLLAEWQAPLYQHLCYSLPTPDNAYDVLQDTIEELVVAIQRFDGQVAISTYIYSIASRKVADFFRERKTVIEIPELLNIDYPNISSDSSIFPDVLNDLPSQYRRALLLRYRLGLTVSEVAQILGHSYKTTELLLSRSRKQLEINLRKVGISL